MKLSYTKVFSDFNISFFLVYSGSSGDLACHASSDTLQVPKASVNRNGSFNLADCRRDRNQDKKLSRFDRNRLKHVAQYQPPPIPNSPFEQDGMKAAFEMHLDKGEDVQKKNKLKNFFSNRNPQKPSALEIPKESQKTLLGRFILFISLIIFTIYFIILLFRIFFILFIDFINYLTNFRRFSRISKDFNIFSMILKIVLEF